MPVLRGTCPGCGAPIEFSVGSSVCRVCEFCRATVYRTDRGLEDLGKVGALANVPSLVAVGDEGTLAGRPFHVLGRVQLDHGEGPWEEYYLSYDQGAAWGWLAYAEGQWMATQVATPANGVPPFEALKLEQDVALGSAGTFRVTERRAGTIVAAEGELPERFPPGFARHYADLWGAGDGFATLDYGDLTAAPVAFVGRRLPEGDLVVRPGSPRPGVEAPLADLRCPSCGGDQPLVSGRRAERVGCRYCGALVDLATHRAIAAQDEAGATAPILLGSTGTLSGVRYTCIAMVERAAEIEGEEFSWVELLLFADGGGYRWLVRDESSWLLTTQVNVAELDLRDAARTVHFRGARYSLRNRNPARVTRVLGEVYWKVRVGETVKASDYTRGHDVLSREENPGEVRWSHSSPMPWPVIASAFGVRGPTPVAGVKAPSFASAIVTLVVILVVMLVVVGALFDDDDDQDSAGAGFHGGSGWFYGGK